MNIFFIIYQLVTTIFLSSGITLCTLNIWEGDKEGNPKRYNRIKYLSITLILVGTFLFLSAIIYMENGGF